METSNLAAAARRERPDPIDETTRRRRSLQSGAVIKAGLMARQQSGNNDESHFKPIGNHKRFTQTETSSRNWSVYNRSLKQRGSLAIRFDRKSDWRARPPGKRRRQPRYGPHYSDAAIQACLTIKVLFGLPLRQTTGLVAGLVESLLGLVDLDCDVADDSRLCRRQKTLSVAIAGQGRSGPVRAQKVRCTCWWTARAYSTVIQGRRGGRMERRQARRRQTPPLAQDPHRS